MPKNNLDYLVNMHIFEALVSPSKLGVIIYQEKIVFANDYAKRLLGYSGQELYSLSSIDIVFSEDKAVTIQDSKRRLRGEKFSAIYDIRFQRKDGSVVFVECFTHTIVFRGRYSGLILFYDITSKKIAEKSKEILMRINRIITSSLTEEEIYSEICKSLVEQFNLEFAWVAIVDEENNKLIPKYYYGYDDGLLEIFDYQIYSETLSGISIFKGEIAINQDSRQYLKEQPCAEELVKRGFMSSCTIPISKDGKVISLLKIYSRFPNFFNESIIDILKEIQRDISFAIEKVEKLRNDITVSEAFKNSDIWILITDEQGRILYVSEAVERISGYSKEELIGKNPRIFKSGLNPPEFYKTMWDTILSGRIFHSITPNRKKDGEIFHVDLKIIPVKLPGNILRFVAVARDVTENLKLSERLQKLSNYDALTGLLNMNGFVTLVSQMLNKTLGLGIFILIDIYDMTTFNKIHGINTGDKFLKEFGKKIKTLFNDTDAVSRIAADTFGVYLTGETTEDIYKTYSRLCELENAVFEIDGKTVSANINAAISLYPKDGKDFKTLYERADITLQKIKKLGAGVIQFFDPQIEKEAEKLWDIINLIKKANEKRLFRFYYQPYFYTDSLKTAGFEALVRIIDEDGKIYTPDYFIDYLENSHYLSFFENWAIQEVIDKMRKWNISISLNISGKTFNNPVFLYMIASVPEEIRHLLTVEITERMFINNIDFAMHILSEIKKIENPPNIALDDFGTGYSAMSYLRDLPVDIIKIDRSFIKEIAVDRKSLAIVQTIIELAKRLEKRTLAEGVETEAQYEILKSFGCDLVQGFFFSKPLAEKDCQSFLNR